MKDRLKDLYKNYFKREDLYLKSEKGWINTEKAIPGKRRRELENELAKAKQILAGLQQKMLRARNL